MIERRLSKAGDRLDQIVFARYGSLVNFEKILLLNPLAARCEILPAGIEIFLPDFEAEYAEIKRLWS